VYNLNVIAENGNDFREKHPEIPWREVASLRNVIAHEYFGLDNTILWDVIQTQILVLTEKFRNMTVK
jgi:uncharacterized protein with HEPN domain